MTINHNGDKRTTAITTSASTRSEEEATTWTKATATGTISTETDDDDKYKGRSTYCSRLFYKIIIGRVDLSQVSQAVGKIYVAKRTLVDTQMRNTFINEYHVTHSVLSFIINRRHSCVKTQHQQ